MPVDLKPLTDAQWETISDCLPPPRRSTRTDARIVFQTALHMLWYQKPYRSMRGREFCSPSVLSSTLWTWAESGALPKAWAAYLAGVGSLHIRHWKKVFDFYEQSWQHRRVASQHAGKVHSLWFHQLASGLRREIQCRKRP
jgi:transposase